MIRMRSATILSSASSSACSRRRFLATTSGSTSLAGRPRFYREVSVAPSPAPWITAAQAAGTTNGASTNHPDQGSVPSPVSAGVDGTDSATGVVVVRRGGSGGAGRRSAKYYERWLIPRAPDRQQQGLADFAVKDDEGPARSSVDGPTSVGRKPEWFAICLDGRPLQTPVKSRLAVPSRILAAAIASEWNAQSPTLRPTQMPLTTLSCTVLDQVCEQPQSYQASVLRYLPTDTLRFWADPTIDPHLHAEQSRLWTPILQILEERILGQPFPTTTADANVIIPNPRHGADRNSSYSIGIGSPQNSLAERCQEWVESLDAWHLGILYSLTVEAKSLALAMAYLHGGSNHRPDDVAAAADGGGVGVGGTSLLRDLWIPACRVEEEVQISQWGMVEGGHDYDRLNCSIQVHAAAFLHQCLKHERLVGRAALKPQ